MVKAFHGKDSEFEVDYDAITRLFPDDDILALYAEHPNIEATDEQTAACLRALQTEAAVRSTG